MKLYHEYINEPWKKLLFWGILLILIGLILFLIGGLIGYGLSSNNPAYNFFNGEVWDHVFSFIR